MAQAAPKMSSEAVQVATGKNWEEWFAILDAAGAKEKTHKEIAQWLHDSGTLTLPWWGQMVTVGYEQHIGRRETGQNCEGDYRVNATKTVNGTLDSVLALWQKRVDGLSEFNGVPVAGEPRVSSSDKWRYWRVDLADGTGINVNVGIKCEGKMSLAVEHRKLADKEASEAWRAYWKRFLGDL